MKVEITADNKINEMSHYSILFSALQIAFTR